MTMPTPPVKSSGWTVTSQTQGMQAGPDGNITQGVEVYARTGNGTDFSVFVPNSRYTPSVVQEMLAERAAQVDAVGALSAPPK